MAASSFQPGVLIGQKGNVRLSGAFLLFNGIDKASTGTAGLESLGDFEASPNRTYVPRRLTQPLYEWRDTAKAEREPGYIRFQDIPLASFRMFRQDGWDFPAALSIGSDSQHLRVVLLERQGIGHAVGDDPLAEGWAGKTRLKLCSFGA